MSAELYRVTLSRVGETKRTVVYGIPTEDGKRASPEQHPVNTLYVGKTVLPTPVPSKIVIVVAAG